MEKLYFYVVDRDFGFAPNPFHGYCTLATCKPKIRARAGVGDWVIGMGGARLKATGHLVFAMRVSETISFNEYWFGTSYLDKRPVRNGSSKMIVGDNIYHRDASDYLWHQTDSHHSNADGSTNAYNLAKDTKADRVLVSSNFFYFGTQAPYVPQGILDAMDYRNCRDYRIFDRAICSGFLNWLHTTFGDSLNLVLGDPFDFAQSYKRYSVKDNRIR